MSTSASACFSDCVNNSSGVGFGEHILQSIECAGQARREQVISREALQQRAQLIN